MSYMAGVPLQPTTKQVESVEWLNLNRGKLIHFGRTGLVLDARFLLDDVGNGLDIVETLLFRTRYMSKEVIGGPIDTVADPTHSDRIRELISNIRTELMAARQRYGLPGCALD